MIKWELGSYQVSPCAWLRHFVINAYFPFHEGKGKVEMKKEHFERVVKDVDNALERFLTFEGPPTEFPSPEIFRGYKDTLRCAYEQLRQASYPNDSQRVVDILKSLSNMMPSHS